MGFEHGIILPSHSSCHREVASDGAHCGQVVI